MGVVSRGEVVELFEGVLVFALRGSGDLIRGDLIQLKLESRRVRFWT